MPSTNEDILRPVSTLEYNARKFGFVVSRNKMRGKLSLRQFREALKIIAQRHPFLSAAFHDSPEGKTYFKKREAFSIPLTIKEGIQTEEEKNRLYEEELNGRLNSYEQLWRVLIILDGKEDEINANSLTEMVLTVQHVICDGLSILNLAKEILEQTRALQRGEPLYENQPLPVMPPMDEYLPGIIHSHSPFKMVRPFFTPIDHSSLGMIAADADHAPEEKEIDYSAIDVLDRDLSIPKAQCRIRFFDGRYSVPELRSLCGHCKHINVSVHGILTACMIKAISECVATPSGRAVNLLLRNPVNRRVQAAPGSGGIGNQHLLNFVVSELVLCPVDATTPIIELAHQFMEKLDYEIKTHQALRRYQSVAESKEIAKINKEKDAQILTVSNAGLIDTPANYDDFELLETNFISSNKHIALQFSLTAFAGHLNYVLLYTSPWYKTGLIEALHQRFKEHLHDYINLR